MEIKKLMNPYYLYYKRGNIIPKLFSIAIKVLYIPGIKKWFDGVVKAYEGEFVRRELDVFSKKQKSYVVKFKQYLPDTEERIERLRRLINKRPVAIILHGPSLIELEENITELESCDICYLGLNTFRVPEKNILQKINRDFSVVMCSDPFEMLAQFKNHNLIDFLERQENNIFISSRKSFREQPMRSLCLNVDKFIQKYDKKLLFFTASPASVLLRGGLFLQIPSIEYPLHFPAQSSFSVLLSLALIGEAKMVVVFGGDGGRIEGQELYFRESGSALRQYNVLDSSREWGLMMDAKTFNLTMPLILEKINKIYNLRHVDIINCSLHSRYTPLRKLSYNDTFSLLKSFKSDVSWKMKKV